MSERWKGELDNLRTMLHISQREAQSNENRIKDHVAAAKYLRTRRAEIRAQIASINQRIKEAEKP